METAEQYFRRFSSGGASQIESLVGVGEEDLWLEFKVATLESGKLSKKDKQSFAKSASAFANADGGVIIWGVHAKPGPNGMDVVQKTDGVEDPDDFRHLLAGVEGQLLGPPVAGISHLVVARDTANLGFIVTHVPKGQSFHMARGEDQHCYFLRTSRGTHRMEAFEVQGRYSAAPPPSLTVPARVEPSGASSGGGDADYDMKIIFSIHNDGPGTGRHPAIRLHRLLGEMPDWEKNPLTGFHHRRTASHVEPADRRTYVGPDVLIFPGFTVDVAYAEITWVYMKNGNRLPELGLQRYEYELFHEGRPLKGYFDIELQEETGTRSGMKLLHFGPKDEQQL